MCLSKGVTGGFLPLGVTAVREEVVSRPARQSWWTLGLFVLLLAAEWGLRKWAGLP